MHWRSYMFIVNDVFLNSWYDVDDYEHIDLQFAYFKLSVFRQHILEYIETFGIERFWQCQDCAFYHSEFTGEPYNINSYNKCPKRIYTGSVEINAFAEARKDCFLPGLWITSFGQKYYRSDNDKSFKYAYKEAVLSGAYK